VNIYVETNFVLELVFEQEQCSCEPILELCEQHDAKTALAQYNCPIIPRFDSGYNFIQSQVRV
jgi:hypothetical protein